MENYNRQMEKVIAEITKGKTKPKLLLHSCCAPCSSACIERLKEAFDLTVYYYNPNMDTLEEYSLRAQEQQRFCDEMGVNLVVESHLQAEFYFAVKGLENEPEGGARCAVCFKLRLKRTAEFAKNNGFEYFTTTLTVSPLKDANLLNLIGQDVANQTGVKWLPTDFKKKGGYQRSIELSREFGLYRQNYCGCEFSKITNPQKI